MITPIYTLIFFLTFLSGCAESPAGYTKDLVLMDTFVRIEVRGSLSGDVKSRAISSVTERMAYLAEKFDYFKEKSELGKINNLKKGEVLVVSEEMLKILKAAKRFQKETNGAFDVTKGKGGFILDEEKKEVSFDKDGVKIDLGGIAKGFIVDEGIKVLKESGVKDALISAGGDIYCMGNGSGRGWKIGIRDPRKRGKIVGSFNLVEKAVSTSGGYERPGHIVEPHTGEPINKITRSATVIAGNCMTTDALATAVYVLGPKDGLRIIEQIPDTECFIIDEDGTRHISKGFPPIHT